MKHVSKSAEQTKQIAADFAHTLKGGEVVLLEGELGSGKTTFVQGVLEFFGYDRPVRSPTFTIMNLYKVDHGQIKQVAHFDFYRLDEKVDLAELGLEEWLKRDDTIVLIEWPKADFAIAAKKILFKLIDENQRSIEIID